MVPPQPLCYLVHFMCPATYVLWFVSTSEFQRVCQCYTTCCQYTVAATGASARRTTLATLMERPPNHLVRSGPGATALTEPTWKSRTPGAPMAPSIIICVCTDTQRIRTSSTTASHCNGAAPTVLGPQVSTTPCLCESLRPTSIRTLLHTSASDNVRHGHLEPL